MSDLRHQLLKLAHSTPNLRANLVPLLASTRTAKKMTEEEWKTYKKKHPGAKKEKHEISKSDGAKGKDKGKDKGKGKGTKIPPGIDLSGLSPEQVDEFVGSIPEYKLEILAGGDDGQVTEADLRRAKAVKVQLKRGIQAAADICKMSPPVCAGNFGVARSSMPQLSADESIKDMLKTDEQRVSDMGDKWDSLSDEKKAKSKKGWATDRKKGDAAVAAGADPNDDRTVFKQLLDSVAKEGTKIGTQDPPFEKVDVGQLKATQREIKAGKTYGIANAYLSGDYDPRESPIIISSDNHILDGHHRYSAMITADPEAKMNVIRVDLPMKDFLERSFEQPGVFRADIQDNIISSDDPLDLSRAPGSSWQQKGKWYAKNKEGEASGPFKDKDGAEAYSSGKKKDKKEDKKMDKKKDKPKKQASQKQASQKTAPTLKGRLAKLAFDNPDMREALMPLLTKTAARPINQIAREISKDWGSKVNYAAKPYLQAMFDIRDITDMYGSDTAKGIVLRFLGNAGSWRGPKAKEIKAELKKMVR